MNSLDSITDDLLINQVFSHYVERLKCTPRALDYLRQRDIDPELMIERRLCGFCDRTLGYQLPDPDSPEGHLVRGQLQRIGLLKPSGHELMRGALVFPLTDTEGHICQMYGKRITAKLKAGSVYEVVWNSGAGACFNRAGLAKKEVCQFPTPLLAAAAICAGCDGAVCLGDGGCHV